MAVPYDYIFLVLGILAAGLGGELFVRGAVGLAQWARISAGIIGATVAAFATCTPEISVAVNAALARTPEISLGDALGSNVVNVALVLGVTLLLGGLQSERGDINRDYPVALLVPVIVGVLAIDGTLSRLDGILLFGVFLAWMIAVIVEVRRQRDATEEVLGEHRGWLALLFIFIGLVLLVVAGRLIVTGARGLAEAWGLNEFVIGAVIVAFGTSVPELATAVISKMRGHDEVGLGTILGSNIFNGFFIVAIVCVLAPITISWRELLPALIFGLVTSALLLPNRNGFIERRRGAVLLVLYVLFLFVSWQAG